MIRMPCAIRRTGRWSVSWHDARAFCDWLSERWRDAAAGRLVCRPAVGSRVGESRARWRADPVGKRSTGPLQDGFSSGRIGTAEQPATAARLALGRRMGCRQENAENEHRCERARRAASRWDAAPYGCEDLAGNVWEWTRSLWGTDWRKPDFVYPYDARDLKREDLAAPDDIWRVVRGGSWFNRRGGARCASRERGSPWLSDWQSRFSGGVAFFPCSLTLSSAPSWPLSLRVLRLRRGGGGNFPRRAAPLIFTTPSRTVCPTSAFPSRQHDHHQKDLPRLLAGTRRRPPASSRFSSARENQVVGQAGGLELELVLWEDFLGRRFPHAPARRVPARDRSLRHLRPALLHQASAPILRKSSTAAYEQFQATGKTAHPDLFQGRRSHQRRHAPTLLSLWAFQDKLEALGHFPTEVRERRPAASCTSASNSTNSPPAASATRRPTAARAPPRRPAAAASRRDSQATGPDQPG
jgi:hypothetical protein